MNTKQIDFNGNATFISQTNEYEGIPTINPKKTFITATKIIDIYFDNIQIEHDHPRDDIEEHYMNQLKNYESNRRIQLYDGEPIPEDFVLEVDGSGRIIPKTQTTLDRWLNKIKFW
jgi:hypothetical protein